MLPFKVSELRDAVAAGRVTARRHPSLPYTIYNYAKEIQWLRDWDEVTLTCRGLILDDNYNIIARPWRKFFNLGERNLPIQFTDPVEVMDKADGSLGIVYPIYDPYFTDNVNGFAVATRGSFESEQAIHASTVLKNRYSHVFPALSQNDSRRDVLLKYTFLFEIVFPGNRIVLDYNGMDDLILLGAVENSTGYYLGPLEAQGISGWDGPVVEVFPYKNISEALAHMGRSNAEGYVIRSHNWLVKIKEPDYVDLHRLVTNANPKTVWEQLAVGRSKGEIISQFPDEFHTYIEGMIDPLMERYAKRLAEILDGYSKVTNLIYRSAGESVPTRAIFAQEFKKHADAKYYFLLLDNRPVNKVLWQELKPKINLDNPDTD